MWTRKNKAALMNAPKAVPQWRQAVGTGLVIALWLLALPALAMEDLDIEADQMEADGQTGLLIYRGNVRMRHEDLDIQADVMRAHESETGELSLAEFEGSPATFRMHGAEGDKLDGQARKLTYDAPREHLLLQGEAQLRQGQRRMSAERIEYHMATERIQAQRGDGEEGRVRVRFQQGKSTPDRESKENGSE